jgi:hypothetical protein
METSPLSVKGCKMLAYARLLRPLSREGSLSCHTCCDTGPRFFLFHPKDRPIQSPLTTHEDGWMIYRFSKLSPLYFTQSLMRLTHSFIPLNYYFSNNYRIFSYFLLRYSANLTLGKTMTLPNLRPRYLLSFLPLKIRYIIHLKCTIDLKHIFCFF